MKFTPGQIDEIKRRHACDAYLMKLATPTVKLRRNAGKKGGYVGPCPFCSPDPDSKSDSRLYCTADLWACAACPAGGSIVDLVAKDTERPWDSSRVGTGVAYAIATSLVNDEMFSGFPAFRFELPGVPLYDPSRDSTAGGSGTQRWSNPATWGGDGDNLPAVQSYNVLRGIRYAGDWLYGLQSLTAARLPEVPWINAVNRCRAQVQGENGFEPTYRAGHECRVSTQHADTIEVLMTACHGRMAEIGGIYKMRAGPPDDFVLSFTDDDIINTAEQSFTPFFGLAQKITGITATYPEPEEAWQTKEAPPLYRADLEVKAGDRRLLSNVSMAAVPYAAQVQRLMSSALEAAQRARRHSFTMPPIWYLVEPLDVVRWQISTRNGYVDKLFEVDGLGDLENADQLADLTEVDPTDYDWDFDSDFSPVSRTTISFQRPTAQSIRDWSAQGVVIDDPSGFKRQAAILLSWDGDQADVAGVAFEVRDTDGVLVHKNRTDILNDGASAVRISQNILPDCDYFVRGRYIPKSSRETLWSDDIPVTTPDVRQTLVEFEQWIKYQVATLQDQHREDIDNLRAALQTAANQDARNWNDKQVIKRQFNSRTDKAFAQVEEAIEIATNAQQAFASFTTTVTASFGSLTAFVSQTAQAVAGVNTIGAKYAITLDVNGYASGFELLNGGGGFSSTTFYTSTFQIVNPLFSPKSVFTVGSINGTPAIGIAANMFLDGTLHARAIQAGTIDTLALAINGVDIFNIVAGSATKIDSTTIGSVTVGPGSESVLCSATISCPVACVALIAGSAGFHSTLGGFVVSGATYFTATEDWTKVRIYVDGVLAPGGESIYTTPQFANAGPSANIAVRLPISTSAPLLKAVSLSAGSHTIEVRAICANFGGFTGAPVFDVGGFAVFQSRR